MARAQLGVFWLVGSETSLNKKENLLEHVENTPKLTSVGGQGLGEQKLALPLILCSLFSPFSVTPRLKISWP